MYPKMVSLNDTSPKEVLFKETILSIRGDEDL